MTPEVSVVRAAAELPAAAWDRLAADRGVLASRGWLQALEDQGPGLHEPRYVLVSRGGELTGAAACWVWRRAEGAASPDNLLLGRLRPAAGRLGASFLPALQCGPARGFGGPYLLGEDRAAALAAVERLASAEHLPLHLARLLEGDGDEAALAATLAARGYHITAQDPVAVLDLPFRRFAEYVESLRAVSHNMPSQVRKEMRRPAKDGIVIAEIADPWPHAARLHALSEAHHRRLNGAPAPYPAAFLPAIKHRLGDRCVLYGAFAGAELLGFTLVVRDRRTLHAMFVGIDERARRSCAYFSLAFYRPIADAIEAGIGRVHFGALLHDVKRRRGCRLVASRFAYRAPTPLRQAALAPWFALHRAWGARRFAAPL